MGVFKWDKLAEIKGITAIALIMNAFLLISILALYLVLKPEDPALLADFRNQIRMVYLISFVLGNITMLYSHWSRQKQKQKEAEEKRRERQEKLARKKEAQKKREEAIRQTGRK
ncbi:MAG: hypothetical protein RBT41_03780 [Clostridia bacterium]|nr:hypothetical protein [Clostridia bacterium]